MNKNNIGYIINESTANAIEFEVKEETNNRVIAEGIIQTAEQLNRNKRCYSAGDLDREIHSARSKELMKTGNFKGEAGHPQCKELGRQAVIDPKLVQVKYTKIWMDGNNVKAQFMGTNNDLGESFDKDLRCGEKPSFSLRALGSIENNNGRAYVKNLKVITWDRVYYPSHPTAYTEKIISEGASFLNTQYKFRTPDIVKEYGNEMVVQEGWQLLAPISNKSVTDYIMQESANLKTIIQNFDTFYQSIALNEDASMVTMIDKDYNTIYVPVEKYIKNEIMDFCYRGL